MAGESTNGINTGWDWLDGALNATLAYQAIKSQERITKAQAQIESLKAVTYPENTNAQVSDPRAWGTAGAIGGGFSINNTTAVVLLALAAAVGLVMVLR